MLCLQAGFGKIWLLVWVYTMCLVEDNSLPIPSGKENILIITGVINQVYFPNNVLKENDFS